MTAAEFLRNWAARQEYYDRMAGLVLAIGIALAAGSLGAILYVIF